MVTLETVISRNLAESGFSATDFMIEPLSEPLPSTLEENSPINLEVILIKLG